MTMVFFFQFVTFWAVFTMTERGLSIPRTNVKPALVM